MTRVVKSDSGKESTEEPQPFEGWELNEAQRNFLESFLTEEDTSQVKEKD